MSETLDDPPVPLEPRSRDVTYADGGRRREVDYRILGPLEVHSEGRLLNIGAAKPRALLVRLLIERGRALPSERLIDDLWEGEPPRSAVQTLQTYVSQLRKSLAAGRVVTGPGGYRLVARRRPARCGRLRSRHRGGSQGMGSWRRGRRGGELPPRAGAVARFRARGGRRRGVGVDEVARLSEHRLAAVEGELEARLALGELQRRRRRGGGVRGGASVARTAVGAADDRAVPRRSPGRGVAGVPAAAAPARRGARPRTEPGDTGARTPDPAPRSRRRRTDAHRRCGGAAPQPAPLPIGCRHLLPHRHRRFDPALGACTPTR